MGAIDKPLGRLYNVPTWEIRCRGCCLRQEIVGKLTALVQYSGEVVAFVDSIGAINPTRCYDFAYRGADERIEVLKVAR